jgi:hypothetical protein
MAIGADIANRGDRCRRRQRTYSLAVALVAIAWALSGCGVYSASSGRVDPSLRRVAVEYFENRTPEADLGIELAELVIAALQEDNLLRVVDFPAADTVLEGTVTRYFLRQASISPDQQVDEFQVQISVELTFRVKSTGQAIFENRRFNGTGNYLLNDPGGSSEETAKREAANEITRDVLAQIVEDW